MKLIIKTALSPSASFAIDADELTILRLCDFLKNFCGNSYKINIASLDHLNSLKKNRSALKVKNKNYFKYICRSDDAEVV